MRNIYLESTPLNEALNKWITKLEHEGLLYPFKSETVKVIDSLGRITAEAISSKISSPFYHSSAMDGYAVRFTETFRASERTPKRLIIGKQAVYVDTGDPLPEGYNAVIMIEDINNAGLQETCLLITYPNTILIKITTKTAKLLNKVVLFLKFSCF